MQDAGFEELLQKYKSVTIHKNNLQNLATKVFKSLNGLSPPIMFDLFEKKAVQYNLCGNNLLKHAPLRLVSRVLKYYASKAVFGGLKFQMNLKI